MVNAERCYIIIKACSILKSAPEGAVIWKVTQSLSPFWQRKPYEALGNSLYNTAFRTPVETGNRYFLTLFSVLYFSVK